jgi:hypothetical protein
MRRLAICFTIALLAGSAAPLRAQAPDPAVTAPADSLTEVRLRDGSVLIGRVESQSETQVVLMTRSGARVEIPRGEILSLRSVALRADGEVWPEDPNHTRLFFTSTGRALRKGEGYVASFYLFLPFVAYGVTDRFTIAGGTPILPEVFGRVFYVAPKYTVFDSPRHSFAVGGLGFLAPSIDEGSLGILYGVSTHGTRDRAVSVGAGWGYFVGDGYAGTSNEPVFMLGGEQRISRRVKLITENWFVVNPGVDGVWSGGFRFIGDRLSADLGFIGQGGCCLPLVNFVWAFGNQSALR